MNSTILALEQSSLFCTMALSNGDLVREVGFKKNKMSI